MERGKKIFFFSICMTSYSPSLSSMTFTIFFRTHTIILVDWENKVEFHEWTLEEPIISQNDSKWIETHEKFSFEL